MDKYRTFLTAAKFKTFYDAAEEMYITPATVSKHIASLEKELNVVLFRRLSHGVELTPEGKERVPIVKQMMTAYDEFMHNSESGASTELSVYTMPPPSRFGLSEILRDFAIERPNIHVVIIEQLQPVRAIIDGECELGFVRIKIQNPNLLQGIRMRIGRMGVILHGDHPMSDRECISLTELKDEEFIFPNPETGAYQIYMDYCKEFGGFNPKVKQTGVRDDSLLFFVSNAQGISLFTQEMFSLFKYDDVVFVPLKESLHMEGHLIKARNRQLTPEAQAFWNFIRKRSKSCEPWNDDVR
ncbi:MAG: LysR family transcriptional regulator [Clostridiales bacterium]|nr:LysR family transcriptional regulator [Clostridiales bacterium]